MLLYFVNYCQMHRTLNLIIDNNNNAVAEEVEITVAIQTTMDQEAQDLVDPNTCQNDVDFEILMSTKRALSFFYLRLNYTYNYSYLSNKQDLVF